MRKLYWGRVLAPTDFHGAWVVAKVRPRAVWALCRIRLFLRIVWRKPDTAPGCTRLDWRTAWDVSNAAIGLVGPVAVHRGKPVWPQEADHD